MFGYRGCIASASAYFALMSALDGRDRTYGWGRLPLLRRGLLTLAAASGSCLPLSFVSHPDSDARVKEEGLVPIVRPGL